jgi:prepilin-type N-terminal cleavage/methylation domain-containing protein
MPEFTFPCRRRSPSPADGTQFRCARKRRASRAGYTVLELIVVLAILVILSSIIVPSVDSFYGNYKLTQAADMVRTAWAEARTRALNEARPYRFAIVPNKGNFRIAPDLTEYWSNALPTASATAPAPLISSRSLPDGLRFSADSPDSGPASGPSSLPDAKVPLDAWASKAVFRPNGSAKQDVEIIFGDKKTRQLTLRLRALTGAVTARWSSSREEKRP